MMCDVMDQAMVQATCDAIVAKYGKVDTLLNAAGGIRLGTPAVEPRRAVPARTSRPVVQLRVVRGGHAA